MPPVNKDFNYKADPNYINDPNVIIKLNLVENRLESVGKNVEDISSALFRNGEHLNIVSRLAIAEDRIEKQNYEIQETQRIIKEIQHDIAGLPEKIKNSVKAGLADNNEKFVDWRSFGLAVITFIFAVIVAGIKFIADWFSKG